MYQARLLLCSTWLIAHTVWNWLKFPRKICYELAEAPKENTLDTGWNSWEKSFRNWLKFPRKICYKLAEAPKENTLDTGWNFWEKSFRNWLKFPRKLHVPACKQIRAKDLSQVLKTSINFYRHLSLRKRSSITWDFSQMKWGLSGEYRCYGQGIQHQMEKSNILTNSQQWIEEIVWQM
jgi:hypothetical protein